MTSTGGMMTFTIEEISVPDDVDGPTGEKFRQYAAVHDQVEASTLGTDLLTMQLPELAAEYRSNPYRVRRHFAAILDGEMIGRALVTSRPLTPETGTHLMVDVLPSWRGKGVGSALHDVVDQAARDASVLKVAVTHTAPGTGESIRPSTGHGTVPADDAGARFLTSHGFTLEQVVRINLLQLSDLPGRAESLRAGLPDSSSYDLVGWTGPTPAERISDLALLRTRMSTDAPSGGMIMTEDVWDANRIREHDDRIATSGRAAVTVGARHVQTDTLVGFTEVLVTTGSPLAVQEDTLVLSEHRGHRLGLRLKLAAAEALRQEFAPVQAIVTWNAEENRPMLDVNEAMGFVAIGVEGSWQKRR